MGLDDKSVIEFGRVPFDRQQRPDRNRFVAVQSAALSMPRDARPDPASEGNSVLVTGVVHTINGESLP